MAEAAPRRLRWAPNTSNFPSIERRLIAFLVVGGIMPLIIMAVLAYLQSRSSLEDAVESELQSVARLSDQAVARWFEGRESDARGFSVFPFVGTEEEAAFLPANQLLEHFLETSGGTYDAIYLTDPSGRVVEGVLRDAEGIQTGIQVGHNFGETEFFTESRETGLAHSDVVFYEPLNVTTMFFAQALTNNQGTLILQVSPTELQSLMSSFTLEDGHTYLQSGEFLVSQEGITPLQAGNAKTPLDPAGVASIEGFDGEAAYSSWRGNEADNYVVYAEVPRENALSAVTQLGLILLVITVVAMVLSAGAAYVTARVVTRPITHLTKAARQIAGGSWDTELKIESRDEIGLLANAFNDMTGNLRIRVYEETRNREYLEQVLTSYMKFVERVSRGDLSARLSLNGQTGENLIVANVNVDQDDNLLRLGYNLNRMVEALHSMASQTRDVANSLTDSAVQILDTSTSQISSATQQDASVSQTTSTVAEIRATVAETAERAQMVAEAAQQSVEISRQGQIAVAETIEGMNVIRSRVESIAENILMLSERTTQIGDIIATVNAIADQSKMLALNASIEAARAGEEGRGFAVVAMEVRNLAEQSREATAQVRDILSEIQGATNTAVMVTEEGTKGVDLGVQLVDRAGRAIRELAGKLEDASQSAMQIAASTRQQSQGMDQLTAAMSSIKAATSSTATSMQQAQRNAKDLNEMASQMESAISQYRL